MRKNGNCKVSKGNTGKIRSDKTKKQISESMIGIARTEEHRQNLSDSFRGNQNCLGKQNTLGYKHTEEARKRIGDAFRGKTTNHKGKTWKIVDGKRVWTDKEVIFEDIGRNRLYQ